VYRPGGVLVGHAWVRAQAWESASSIVRRVHVLGWGGVGLWFQQASNKRVIRWVWLAWGKRFGGSVRPVTLLARAHHRQPQRPSLPL